MNAEERIGMKLKRRLGSPRATVFLEFSVVAPFAMALILFAHDFTSILYAEQQLEIGARAAADIESHLNHYFPSKNEKDTGPHKITKRFVKPYLAQAIGLADNAKAAQSTAVCKDIFIKGDSSPVPGVGKIFTTFQNILDGSAFSGGSGVAATVFRLLSSILGTILNILTLGTHVYFTEIPLHDRMVSMSVSARVPTIMPRRVYDFFSARPVKAGELGADKALVVQARYVIDEKSVWGRKNEPDLTRRVRSYCVMPVIDTMPVAPFTVVRKLRGSLKWVPDKFWPND